MIICVPKDCCCMLPGCDDWRDLLTAAQGCELTGKDLKIVTEAFRHVRGCCWCQEWQAQERGMENLTLWEIA